MENIKIDVSELKDITCECGETAFKQAFRLKYLPAIQSPNGRETSVTLAGFVCLGCNTWLDLKEWQVREERRKNEPV